MFLLSPQQQQDTETASSSSSSSPLFFSSLLTAIEEKERVERKISKIFEKEKERTGTLAGCVWEKKKCQNQHPSFPLFLPNQKLTGVSSLSFSSLRSRRFLLTLPASFRARAPWKLPDFQLISENKKGKRERERERERNTQRRNWDTVFSSLTLTSSLFATKTKNPKKKKTNKK